MDYEKYLSFNNLSMLIILLITGYVIISCINYQTRVFEGLTNKMPNPLNSKLNESSTYNNLDGTIMDLSDKVKDHINYDKHKDKIDNLITSLHEYSQYQLLERYGAYANNISQNNVSGASENLDQINKLHSSISSLMRSQHFMGQT